MAVSLGYRIETIRFASLMAQRSNEQRPKEALFSRSMFVTQEVSIEEAGMDHSHQSFILGWCPTN